MSEEQRQEADSLDGVPLPEEQGILVGHASAFAGIAAQADAGHLPSAILLHGPQGIGKATLAFQLARRILTATGDEPAERIGEQVAAGVHPNLTVLRRRPNDKGKGFYTVIRVDEVRELRDRLSRTRGRAGWRVAIIDAIDDANASAANALLKTLEEPPAETVFLLVSHRPGQLLPTIRSRCHLVPLRPLADDEVRTVLGAGEGDEVDTAVRLARGRPRRAFEALAMGQGTALGALTDWLADPAGAPPGRHLGIADALGADPRGPAASFARELLLEAIAGEARQAAGGPRWQLASANELWDKAQALFADADALNLDLAQCLVSVMDALRAHRDPAFSTRAS